MNELIQNRDLHVKKIAKRCIVPLLILIGSTYADTNTTTVKSYGNFKKMVSTAKTQGVVDLQQAISPANEYAVGALRHGLGEITVIDSMVWLDYGKDGFGNAFNKIPKQEQAVILATAQVEKWQSIKIDDGLSKEALYENILEEAEDNGVDINKPFPFLLEGRFDTLLLHVINGKNTMAGDHGEKKHFFNQIKEEHRHQIAVVVGFYSSDIQGVYTHPGKSWHLHAVLNERNAGAHVDDIRTDKVILKLPYN